MSLRASAVVLCAVALVGCPSFNEPTPQDAGPSDRGRTDTGALDVGREVSPPTDTGGLDVGDLGPEVLADARGEGTSPDGDRADGAGVDSGAADGGARCEARETCGNGLDDDCNGAADEGCPCVPGSTQRCYEGPPGVAGRGACALGSMRCEGSGEFGAWGRCEGAVAPSAERCDGEDNDCDGLVDEGFCRVGAACARDGEGNPENLCQVCAAPEGVSGPTAWSPRPEGTVCRPPAGPCDATERCVGEACPADGFAPATTVCRPAAGGCDRQELCTGASAACPEDLRAVAGTPCRPSAGVCDRAEACDGSEAECPSDAYEPATTVCRASASAPGCDPEERCPGTGPSCPLDVVTRAPSEELCDGVDNDCDGSVDEGLSRACYPGPAGTSGTGPCRGGTQVCAAGVWGACEGAVVPGPEVCRNGVDEDCDGSADDGCAPCITGMASGSPWQMHRAMGPVCFGRTFSQHGEPGEYDLATIPGEGDSGWRPVTSATIDFVESSALCGRSCSCLNGGEFTYFQTFFDISPGYTVTTLSVTMGAVDDGARVTVFNSRYPSGVHDAGSYILLGGTSVSTNLARYLATGRNRVVITHIDDCCTSRSLTGVRVVLDGTALTVCPP